MQTLLLYFAYFFIYSIIGWAVETLFVMLKTKKFVDRGFLIGPYCPIYGWGAILMTLYLTQYKDNILTVFILGVVICSVLEYLTSYFMEILFKTRWWDYSNKKFNLNGRICGENCLLFGLCGIIVIYLIHTNLEKLIISIPTNIFVSFTIILMIIFVVDNIISLNVINKFKKTLTSIDLRKDSTQEFSKVVKETLVNNHKVLQKRLYSAFPNIDLNKFANNIKNEIKEKTEEFKDKFYVATNQERINMTVNLLQKHAELFLLK